MQAITGGAQGISPILRLYSEGRGGQGPAELLLVEVDELMLCTSIRLLGHRSTKARKDSLRASLKLDSVHPELIIKDSCFRQHICPAGR